MTNSVSNSVKQLEGQVQVLSNELQNSVDTIAFLKEILRREEEAFAYTNQQADKTYIKVTTNVTGIDLDFKVEASEMLALLQKLEQLHHVISHRFYNRFGGEVQYVGSLINDFVLSYMIQNHKVLVVQTHDEFACDVDYHKELYKAMKLAFQHVFGNDKNCKIVREV